LESYQSLRSNAIDELSTQAPHVEFEFFNIIIEIKFDILHHLVLKGFDGSYQWI
jgi:hypothetical protein